MKSIRLPLAMLLVIMVAFSCSERIIEEQVPPPIVTPESGSFSQDQIIRMTMVPADAAVRIYYTTDGTDPTEQSVRYTTELVMGTLLAGADSLMLKARAFKTDLNASATVSRVFKINFLSTVATPSAAATPYGYDITANTPISIYCATTGAAIYYTINGENPTESSTRYTAPFNIQQTGPAVVRARGYKENYNPSQVDTTTFFVNPTTMPVDFILVQGGVFPNGSSQVTLTNFNICTEEVTQAEYQAIMGSNPSLFPGAQNPVDNVSWFDAIKYCNLRSIQEGLNPAYSYLNYGNNPANWPAAWNTDPANHSGITCNWDSFGYRLPSEMEWMFTARGGTNWMGYTYSGSNVIDDVAWYDSNSTGSTHPIKGKAANELGTYDQSGNVNEWVWDIYGNLPTTPLYNPHGPTTGNSRTLRGGSWNSTSVACTVLNGRSGITPITANNTTGFRVARKAP